MELKIFNNPDHPEFGEIRTYIEPDGTVLFCGNDVAKVLKYTNVSKAISDHCRYVTKRYIPHPQSSTKTIEMNFITKGDLCRLIASSEMPEAKAFESWIFDEVIPSVLEHGAYLTPQTIDEILNDPDTIIKLATTLKEERAKSKKLETVNSALTVNNTIMKPKAEYFDELVERNLLTNFRETAKQLEVKEKAFIRFLIDKKYVYRDKRGKLMPYAVHTNNGLFEMKECYNEKTQWSGTQTLVTPKGRETFRLLCIGG